LKYKITPKADLFSISLGSISGLLIFVFCCAVIYDAPHEVISWVKGLGFLLVGGYMTILLERSLRRDQDIMEPSKDDNVIAFKKYTKEKR
jgi:hypothetical protein